MNNINTVIFDLSEVLLNGLLGSQKEISNYLGISIFSLKLNTRELQELFLGNISEDEYLLSLIENNMVKSTKKINLLKKIIREGFSEIDGTRIIIHDLRKSGYKLGLLSVHAREWIQFCEYKFKYESLFDEISYSFEEKECKPAHESFLSLLNRLNSNTTDTIFVDDSANNIKAAAEINIHTILFQSSDQLKEELEVINTSI